MSTAAKRTRTNRTITVDFRDDATYVQLLGNGKAFVEFVCAFLLSLGFQLAHKATCHGGGCLTRHAHYVRLRAAALRLALSPDAPRGRARCPRGDAGWAQCGTLCGALSYVPASPLSSPLCVWPPESGVSADPVWVAAPGVFPSG